MQQRVKRPKRPFSTKYLAKISILKQEGIIEKNSYHWPLRLWIGRRLKHQRKTECGDDHEKTVLLMETHEILTGLKFQDIYAVSY